jgi:hypothetical protein
MWGAPFQSFVTNECKARSLRKAVALILIELRGENEDLYL